MERSPANPGRHTLRAGQPRLLREINQRSVVEAIRHHGPLTRAQIAGLIGVSRPTVADISSELVGAGLLREAGQTRGAKGPRATLYELDHERAWVLGVDIGRRWLRVALADLSGRIVARRDEPAQVGDPGAIVAQLGKASRGLVAEHGRPWEDVVQITIGGPGVVDPRSGGISLSPNLPAWAHPDLLATIRDGFEAPVVFDNDVNLAAVGERWRGHGRGFEHFVYLWIGTGVGAGLVLGGELYRGGNGRAGEVGYLPLGGPEPVAHARRGSFEEAVAADAMVALAVDLGMPEPGSADRILALAGEGDPAATAVAREQARRIALGVAAIAVVVDPQAVILGGGVGANAEVLLGALEEQLALISPLRPHLLASTLGTDGVLHGAVKVALPAAWDQMIARVAGGRPATPGGTPAG